MFIGELISLGVAVSWTATALFAEVGSKRMGSLPFNTIRMAMSLLFLCVTLWLVMGVPIQSVMRCISSCLQRASSMPPWQVSVIPTFHTINSPRDTMAAVPPT